MNNGPDEWVVFVVLTTAMLGCTIVHIRQQRWGRLKGFKWIGELFVGHQIVTDRSRNPVRFGILKWIAGTLVIGSWAGWFFLLRVMIDGE